MHVFTSIHVPLGGLDFMPSSVEVTFSSGSDLICLEKRTIDDNVVESEETFTVSLTTSQERVVFIRDSAVVVIADNDGM